MIIFSQRDPQWSNTLLGHNTDHRFTIGLAGCLLSALAMVATKYGIYTNPLQLNQDFINQGGSYENGGNYVPNSLKRLYSQLQETSVATNNVWQFADFINQGGSVIIQIDFVPDTIATETHYVLLDNLDNGQVTIIDPWTGTARLLSDYYGRTVSKPEDTILQAICINGNIPHIATVTPDPYKLYPDQYYTDTVQVSDEGISYILKRALDQHPELQGRFDFRDADAWNYMAVINNTTFEELNGRVVNGNGFAVNVWDIHPIVKLVPASPVTQPTPTPAVTQVPAEPVKIAPTIIPAFTPEPAYTPQLNAVQYEPPVANIPALVTPTIQIAKDSIIHKTVDGLAKKFGQVVTNTTGVELTAEQFDALKVKAESEAGKAVEQVKILSLQDGTPLGKIRVLLSKINFRGIFKALGYACYALGAYNFIDSGLAEQGRHTFDMLSLGLYSPDVLTGLYAFLAGFVSHGIVKIRDWFLLRQIAKK